jgi:hypothetical protein
MGPLANDPLLKRVRDLACGAGGDPAPLKKDDAAALLERVLAAEASLSAALRRAEKGERERDEWKRLEHETAAAVEAVEAIIRKHLRARDGEGIIVAAERVGQEAARAEALSEDLKVETALSGSWRARAEALEKALRECQFLLSLAAEDRLTDIPRAHAAVRAARALSVGVSRTGGER